MDQPTQELHLCNPRLRARAAELSFSGNTVVSADNPWRLHVSDTGSESTGGGAAALLLAGFDRLASTRHIELLRGVLAVALLASRAFRDCRRRRQDARRDIEAGAARLVTGCRDSSNATARPASASTPAQRALGVLADLLARQAATESPRSTRESSARETIPSFVKTLRRW
jgi:hypothetical protein